MSKSLSGGCGCVVCMFGQVRSCGSGSVVRAGRVVRLGRSSHAVWVISLGRMGCALGNSRLCVWVGRVVFSTSCLQAIQVMHSSRSSHAFGLVGSSHVRETMLKMQSSDYLCAFCTFV